jgi:hypothetical protein
LQQAPDEPPNAYSFAPGHCCPSRYSSPRTMGLELHPGPLSYSGVAEWQPAPVHPLLGITDLSSCSAHTCAQLWVLL